jgi:nucleotide-binding universal stress UspA family protein
MHGPTWQHHQRSSAAWTAQRPRLTPFTAPPRLRAHSTGLVVLHVRSDALGMCSPATAVHQPPFVEPLDAARTAVAIVERPLAAFDPRVPTVMRIESGNPAECLSRAAAQAGQAMIAVGSHGHGPLRAALLGSVSLRLAATAPVPVIIVPPSAAATADGVRRSMRSQRLEAAPGRSRTDDAPCATPACSQALTTSSGRCAEQDERELMSRTQRAP